MRQLSLQVRFLMRFRGPSYFCSCVIALQAFKRWLPVPAELRGCCKVLCPLFNLNDRNIGDAQARTSFAQRASVFVSQLGAPPVPRPLPLQPARLRVGYVSSAAFNNHVRAHLVQLLFEHLDRRVESFCYALAPNDGSRERNRTAGSCEVLCVCFVNRV